VTVVFHTTALRDSQFEVKVGFLFSKRARSLRKASPLTRPLAPFANSAH
jgi:hypothetical protein